MRGVPRPRAAQHSTAHRLRALAVLINHGINHALGATGRQPVAASWSLPPEGPKFAVQAATGSTPVAKPSRVRGRTGRAARAGPTPPGSDAEPDESGVDESHVETWRLVRLAQGGDGDAYGQLYDRYVDTVFRFIYYRVKDRGLAEDFTSETFLRALRRISTISYQGRDIGAWFITIARNIVLDHVKSARHRLEITTAETIESKEQAQSTEAAVLQTLTAERLMQAVSQLGDVQRECVMLRFIHGLSVAETAAVMGKNDGAIKALQHRAVRKLADLVGDELR